MASSGPATPSDNDSEHSSARGSDQNSDGCTGGSTEADHDVMDAFNARITFLLIALGCSVLPALNAVLVYYSTNSLTIEINSISDFSDCLALVVNGMIEYAKLNLRKRRQILVLDLVGGFISLSALLGVAVFGVTHAMQRSHAADMSKDAKVESVELMIPYSVMCLVSDAIALRAWCYLHERMVPKTKATKDPLNIYSSLVHIFVDLTRELSVMATTIWLYFSVTGGEPAHEKFRRALHGDVFGAFLLCFIVLMSSALLLRDSISVLYDLWRPAEKARQTLRPKATQDEGDLKLPVGDAEGHGKAQEERRGGQDYGTMPATGSV